MMGFLDPAAAMAGLMMISLTQGCPPQQMPLVQMEIVNHPVRYDNTQSSAQLGEIPIDTNFSKHSKEVFITGGITRGHIQTSSDTSFAKLWEEGTNVSCLWPKAIRLIIEYKPLVYIASEHQPGSCRYDVIMEHEIRHVNTDIMTLNDFLPQLQANVQYAVDSLGVRGPFDDRQSDAVRNEMQEVISSRLRDTLSEMDAVRRTRQQMIDTRQEYMRLSKLCPREPMGTPRGR